MKQPACGCLDGFTGLICDKHAKEIWEDTPFDDDEARRLGLRPRYQIHMDIFKHGGSARWPHEKG